MPHTPWTRWWGTQASLEMLRPIPRVLDYQTLIPSPIPPTLWGPHRSLFLPHHSHQDRAGSPLREVWTASSAGRIIRPPRRPLICGHERHRGESQSGLGSGHAKHQLLDLASATRSFRDPIHSGPREAEMPVLQQQQLVAKCHARKWLLTGANWKSQKCSGQVPQIALPFTPKETLTPLIPVTLIDSECSSVA